LSSERKQFVGLFETPLRERFARSHASHQSAHIAKRFVALVVSRATT